MRRSVTIFLLIVASVNLSAQKFTLEDVIARAQDSTLAAFRNERALEEAEWEYRQFISSRGAQLSFLLTPSYQKITSEPFTYYYKLRNYNMLNTYGEMRMEKQLNTMGGNYYVSTGAMWTEYFGNDAGRMFSAVPVAAGYSNDLIGYNPYKWEKSVRDFKIESSRKRYEYELASIAREAAGYFIDCLVADKRYELCQANSQVAKRVLEVGKEKFDITSISKNELFALELQQVNAGNALLSAREAKENARNALFSFLQTTCITDSIEFVLPSVPELLTILPQEALSLANANNPTLREKEQAIIEAEQKVDKARIEGSLLQSSVDINLGIQNGDPLFGRLYAERTPFVIGSVTVKIPIWDNGLAKNRNKAAGAALERAKADERETIRGLELEVNVALRNFNIQQELIQTTSEAIEYADESFTLAEELYAGGDIDINTFVLAQNRKDEAYENWLNSLQQYWSAYYALCELCVHIF